MQRSPAQYPGSAVSLTSSTPNVCTVAGQTVSYLHAQDCSLAAHRDATDDFAAADQITSFPIEKATPTIQFSSAPDPAVVDEATISASVMPNEVPTDDFTLTARDTSTACAVHRYDRHGRDHESPVRACGDLRRGCDSDRARRRRLRQSDDKRDDHDRQGDASIAFAGPSTAVVGDNETVTEPSRRTRLWRRSIHDVSEGLVCRCAVRALRRRRGEHCERALRPRRALRHRRHAHRTRWR